MKNQSLLLKSGSFALLFLLGLSIYSYSDNMFNGAYEDCALVLNVMDIFRVFIMMAFFTIVHKEYSNDKNTKLAVWFAGVASVMCVLSSFCDIWVVHLQESLDSLREASYAYDSNVTEDVLEGREHFIYMVQKCAHYLYYAYALLIIALMLAAKSFAKNARLLNATLIACVSLCLCYVILYHPYYGGDYDNLELIEEVYQEKWVIWTMIKKMLYFGSFAYLLLVYANKDKENELPLQKFNAFDWAAVASVCLTMFFFFRNWLYYENGEFDTVLVQGGHGSLSILSVGLVFMAAAVISIARHSYGGKIASGILMILWPILALFMVLNAPLGEFGISIMDLLEYDVPLDSTDVKFGNFVGYICFSILTGILVLCNLNKPVPPAAPAAPVPPVVSAPQQETEVQE